MQAPLHTVSATPVGTAGRLRAVLVASALLALAASAGLSGCVSTPLKSDRLLLAREALGHATNMGADGFAPIEMQAARERLDFARTALIAGDLRRADQLSDQALVNTRLAEARMQSLKAQAIATELRQDRRILQIELQNNQK